MTPSIMTLTTMAPRIIKLIIMTLNIMTVSIVTP
jgi:hypothetical protein